jgi:hypothetical protein
MFPEVCASRNFQFIWSLEPRDAGFESVNSIGILQYMQERRKEGAKARTRNEALALCW